MKIRSSASGRQPGRGSIPIDQNKPAYRYRKNPSIELMSNRGESMALDSLCPKCGGVLPGDAPQGLCPACLMSFGLGKEPAEPLSASPSDPTRTFSANLDRSTLHDDATLPPKIPDPHDSPTEPASTASPSIGAVRYFGDYELISEIARGGMGVVYRARQVSLNRPVALKMILAGNLAGSDDVKRFHIEAEAAANLDHPGIVPIYEIGEHDGQHFFSMGFVEGTGLAAKVSDGPLPPREAAELTKQVAEAMHYAHDKGVIHRDLKPGNVLLDSQGRPKVTDFGLAKKLQGDSGLTQTGQVMGTPSYMPPEQAEGKEVGPLADVYSLGALLYCLLTGRPPFQASSPMDTLMQVLEREPVPPRQLNPSAPRDLETICLKCLAKEPGKRYASAEALAKDLNRYLSGEPILARPVGVGERAAKWARRRPLIAGLMGLVAVVTALGIGGVLWQWRAAVLALAFAEQETGRAKAQTNLAKERLEDAVKARAEENKQKLLAKQHLYDVRMNQAQRSWDDFNGPMLRRILDEQLPENQGGIDRRGFEWNYWQRKLASGQATLRRHLVGRGSLAISPEGSRLAASDGMTITLWDTASGQETFSLAGHGGSVNCVAFSPDGARLASASDDTTIRLWDVATGRLTGTLKGHTKGVVYLKFSPDGSRLASTGMEMKVRVWDVATGLETCTRLTEVSTSAAFSPDGSRIVFPCNDRTVTVWNTANGQERLRLKGHRAPVWLVVFSPDGARIASGDQDGTIKVWDSATGLETTTIKGHTGLAGSLEFSPDHSQLALSNSGPDQPGDVKVWDANTGREKFVLKGHPWAVHCVAFLPDGSRLVSIGGDGIRVWDTTTGLEILMLRYVAAVQSTTAVIWWAIARDGSRFAYACRDGKVRSVNVKDAAAVQKPLTLNVPTGRLTSVAFSPDGSRIASACHDQTVRLWNADTGLPTFILTGHTGSVSSVAFSPDGSRLLSAGGEFKKPGEIKVWDASRGKETMRLKGHEGPVNSASFSPDGSRIVSAGIDGTARVWDATTGRQTLTLKGHTGSVRTVAFSPDGSRIASASSKPFQQGSEEVRVWDATSGNEIFMLKGHSGPVNSVLFSPDGSWIATASSDGTVKVWDAATGGERHTFSGHSGGVASVAFSPDGSRLASAGSELGKSGEVKVWDVATGQETLNLRGHPHPVWSVAFSPNGSRLASCGGDMPTFMKGNTNGEVKVWDARPLNDKPEKPVAGQR
jgi:eukaryotic-like serine/threonine-protein kinase